MWSTSLLSTPSLCLSAIHAPRKGPPGGTMQRHRQEPADHDQRPCDDNIAVVAETAVRCPQTLRPAWLSCSLAVKARCRNSLCPVINPMQLAHADVAAAGSCSHAGLLILRDQGENDASYMRILGCGMYRTQTRCRDPGLDIRKACRTQYMIPPTRLDRLEQMPSPSQSAAGQTCV